MNHQTVHVMTIANSIIGVSILTMPYCFKQCGIVLSTLILIVSSIISRLSCHLLLKSAIMARRRTFEFLAFHTFGSLGKFVIEIGIIGFLFGTCIAFFVVMGDLGPAILAKMTGSVASETMRTSILMALALFCVLPLGLLRNIDSLSSICIATIGFYFCLVLKVIAESIPHLIVGDWVNKVEWWRPAGILQCLPIFSMALFCQTQIFEIYQSMPNASLEKMNDLIRAAVNICTGVYIFVGVFGYIGFSGQTFSGNILMSFSTSLMSDVMKIGFVLSLAFSFPLVIFPCRASLYSLLYKGYHSYTIHDGSDKYIPEGRFKGLTFTIVFTSLVTGVMIPNIELVLGLVGSTIGIMICVMFPAICYITMSTKNTNERRLAQLMVIVGLLVMVLGTYANIYAIEKEYVSYVTENTILMKPEIKETVVEELHLEKPNTAIPPSLMKLDDVNKVSPKENIRQEEPPQQREPPIPPLIKIIPKLPDNLPEIKVTTILNLDKLSNLNVHNKKLNGQESVPIVVEQIPKITKEKSPLNENEPSVDTDKKNMEEVDVEAIKKEEKELIEQQNEELEKVKENLKLLNSLQEQKEREKKSAQGENKSLEDLNQKRQALQVEKQLNAIENVRNEQRKAVEEIQKIAQKAIEKLNENTKIINNEVLKDVLNNQDQEHEKKNNDEHVQVDSDSNGPKLKKESAKTEKTVTNNRQIELQNIHVPLPIVLSSNFSKMINNLNKSIDNQLTNTSKSTNLPLQNVSPSNLRNSIKNEKIVTSIDMATKLKEIVKDDETDIKHREIRSVSNFNELNSSQNKNIEPKVNKCDNNDKSDEITEKKVSENFNLWTTVYTNLLVNKLTDSALNDKITADLKPITRDLKSYVYRKRK